MTGRDPAPWPDDHDPAGWRNTEVFEAATSPTGKRGLTPDHCREGLREAGLRRHVADRLRADAMADLADWMRAARTAGISISEIAQLAGTTRQTVYTLTAG